MKKIQLTNTLFKDAVEQFRCRLQAQGASQGQVYSKPNMVIEFLHYLEQNDKTRLSQIDQKIVTNYFDYLKQRPLQTKQGIMSATYLKKHREAILRFIEFTLTNKGEPVGQGQSGVVIKIAKGDKAAIEIMLEEEIEELFNSCDATMLGIRNKAILSLLYGCGMRRKELLELEVQEIDLSKGWIHIDKSKTKHGRDIPMSPKVQSNIEDYLFNVRNMMLDSHNGLTSFLITERGTRMGNSNLAKIMDKLKEQSSIQKRLSCHLLRHSIATHLHRHLSIEEVAQFLGHKSLDSTMIYIHLKTQYYG
ncbi:hypothetical protein Q763_17595 [Flavobacterium beibuense F44-8]|uniref:Tyr recombinase domain-containing protein n=1 Tax=Flavobacterium beibuense F44-8 TaxID=1406840 RepID=A0A0A2LHC1_9FLAO|nr:tyrosine-type recombinase/integrase [Flavobacterium beibuense]KGO78601.1 hypothetical protein Q763_17595 [Flavobacterium beibuense F44-8]